MTNQAPPSNIDASDLWALIVKQDRAHKVIESPFTLPDGSKAMVAVQILTQEEVQLSTIDAENYTKKAMKSASNSLAKTEVNTGYESMYENRSMIEILSRACRQAVPTVDLKKPFFPNTAAMAKHITTDQLTVLFNQYLTIQHELGPITSNMEQYELDAWVEKLAEGGSTHFLGMLTLAAQNQLILYMANQSWSLLKDKSLPMPQPESLTKIV